MAWINLSKYELAKNQVNLIDSFEIFDRFNFDFRSEFYRR